MVNLKSSITVLLLYGLNTFQTQPLTELMCLSLAWPADRPVKHHSDKHLPSVLPLVFICESLLDSEVLQKVQILLRLLLH